MLKTETPKKFNFTKLLIQFTEQKFITITFLMIILAFLIIVVLYLSYSFYISYKKIRNPNRHLSNKKFPLYNRKLVKLFSISLLRVFITLHFIFKCISGENYNLDNKYSFVVLTRIIVFIVYSDILFKCFNFNGINSTISTFININSRCLFFSFLTYIIMRLTISLARYLTTKSLFFAYSLVIPIHFLFLIILVFGFNFLNFYFYFISKSINEIGKTEKVEKTGKNIQNENLVKTGKNENSEKNENSVKIEATEKSEKINQIIKIASSLDFSTEKILIVDSFPFSYKPPRLITFFNMQKYSYLLINNTWINCSSDDKIYSYLATNIIALQKNFLKSYFFSDLFSINVCAFLIYCGIYIKNIGFYLSTLLIYWTSYRYLRVCLDINDEYYYFETIDNYIISNKKIRRRILKGLVIIYEEFIKNNRIILFNNEALDLELIDFRICKLQSV